MRPHVGDQHPYPRAQTSAFRLFHQHDEILFEFALALGYNNPALQKDRAQLVDQSRPFAHQTVPGPVQRLHVELRLGLCLDETHGRPRCRLRYPLGVTIVVLLRLDVRPHVFRRHQADVVPLRREQPTEMMGAATSFHRDNARR